MQLKCLAQELSHSVLYNLEIWGYTLTWGYIAS